LRDFNNDNRNLPAIIYENLGALPRFIFRGVRWAAIDPTCSRVVTLENRQGLKPMANNFAKYLEIELPPVLKNSQMPACGNQSGTEYIYLLTFGVFCLTFLLLVIQSIRRKDQKLSSILGSFSIVAFDLYASFTNGSPEMSKYRMETEASITLLAMLYLAHFLQNRRHNRSHD
jgi:hypothetical protein